LSERPIQIRPLIEEDWDLVRSIYLAGIATGEATFEVTAPNWAQWNEGHLPAPRLIALSEKTIVGWAALSRVSTRSVYAGVAEVSVYIAPEARGQGVGKKLLEALVTESEKCGIWTLQAGIFPGNLASIALHKWCGFREVGLHERIGKLKGIWRDTVLLERRSKVIGID
jgi:phosphinothricin acetyltransferase